MVEARGRIKCCRDDDDAVIATAAEDKGTNQSTSVDSSTSPVNSDSERPVKQTARSVATSDRTTYAEKANGKRVIRLQIYIHTYIYINIHTHLYI